MTRPSALPLVLTCVAPLLWAAPAPAADSAGDQVAAERVARASWYAFELDEAATVFHGDWVAFVKAKQAREQELDAAARNVPESLRRGALPEGSDARARRVLLLEFEAIASKQTAALKARAKELLQALARGEVEGLVQDCAMYGGPEEKRLEYTRKFLLEHKAEFQKLAKVALAEGSKFGAELQFSSPDPQTGMVGQVRIPFGPPGKKPSDPELTPDRAELELWWSGEVMPEANGPRYAAPRKNAARGHWRFYSLTQPYSRRDDQLL